MVLLNLNTVCMIDILIGQNGENMVKQCKPLVFSSFGGEEKQTD